MEAIGVDFIYDLLIPANTTEKSPKEQDIDIGAGVVHRVEVGFPRGCAGLAHARVRQALTPRWPSNELADYNWDNYVYPVREHHLMKKGDAPLTLVGWNADDTFPHTVTFRFSILSERVMEPMVRLERLFDTFLKLFRKFMQHIGVKEQKGGQ